MKKTGFLLEHFLLFPTLRFVLGRVMVFMFDKRRIPDRGSVKWKSFFVTNLHVWFRLSSSGNFPWFPLTSSLRWRLLVTNASLHGVADRRLARKITFSFSIHSAFPFLMTATLNCQNVASSHSENASMADNVCAADGEGIAEQYLLRVVGRSHFLSSGHFLPSAIFRAWPTFQPSCDWFNYLFTSESCSPADYSFLRFPFSRQQINQPVSTFARSFLFVHFFLSPAGFHPFFT